MLSKILLIIGLALLIKGADWLVNGASQIARKLHISDMAIGLTVVAFGTSMPELFVNIQASITGSSELVIANVLGSNSANILLILGLSAIIYPLSVAKGTVWKEIPFSLLAILVLGILVNDHFFNESSMLLISRGDGIVLLAFFVIFLYYSVSIAHNIHGMHLATHDTNRSIIYAGLFVVLGLCSLAVGAKWIVDGAIVIARQYGMSERIIGLTIVAIGTSLPELATSVVAARKHNVEIAVGNVVGSNIFNIFFILGTSACIRKVPYTVSSNIDIIVVVIASMALFFSMFTGKRKVIDRWEGIVFVVMYGTYITMLLR